MKSMVFRAIMSFNSDSITFWRNIFPPSSGGKLSPGGLLLGLLSDPGDGGGMLFQNSGLFPKTWHVNLEDCTLHNFSCCYFSICYITSNIKLLRVKHAHSTQVLEVGLFK